MTSGGAAGRGPSPSETPYLTPGERLDAEQELQRCDEDTEEARRGSSSKDAQQLLACLERGLHARRRLFAENSAQVSGACRELAEVLNKAACRMLNAENLQGSHDLLKRAEQVADRSELYVERATTWNNLACYYKKKGKLRTAVAYLQRALAIEEHLEMADAAQTHLNLCATLSQLQRRSEAINHAQSALIRIYETLSPLMLSGELDGEGAREHREQITVLAIAYHNLAVEHEYLKDFEAALRAYSFGLRWVRRFFDEGHQMATILANSAEAVKAKLPRGSAALRRAEQLSAGWPARSASSGGESGSGAMGHLMTPRDASQRELPLGEDRAEDSGDEGDPDN